MKRLLEMVESGLIPDGAVRDGIRRLNQMLLNREGAGSCDVRLERFKSLLADLRRRPAPLDDPGPDLPSTFFEQLYGPRLLSSCCLFRRGDETLAEAEGAMLGLALDRADIVDGQRILGLDGPWGALSLWVAEHRPRCHVSIIVGRPSGRSYIEDRCRTRGLANVTVTVGDIETGSHEPSFDRVIVGDAFRCSGRLETLFERVAASLVSGGRCFVELPCHREYAYLLDSEGSWDWLARSFFPGGIMPAEFMPLYQKGTLDIDEHWRLSGRHFATTAERWLARFDAHRELLRPLLAAAYGTDGVKTWIHRWRIYFMTCAELWGYDDGEQWRVAHYRLRKR